LCRYPPFFPQFGAVSFFSPQHLCVVAVVDPRPFPRALLLLSPSDASVFSLSGPSPRANCPALPHFSLLDQVRPFFQGRVLPHRPFFSGVSARLQFFFPSGDLPTSPRRCFSRCRPLRFRPGRVRIRVFWFERLQLFFVLCVPMPFSLGI